MKCCETRRGQSPGADAWGKSLHKSLRTGTRPAGARTEIMCWCGSVIECRGTGVLGNLGPRRMSTFSSGLEFREGVKRAWR